MKKIYLFVLLFFIPVTVLLAQEAPFYKDIHILKHWIKKILPPGMQSCLSVVLLLPNGQM